MFLLFAAKPVSFFNLCSHALSNIQIFFWFQIIFENWIKKETCMTGQNIFFALHFQKALLASYEKINYCEPNDRTIYPHPIV